MTAAGPGVGFRRDLRAELVAGEGTFLFSEQGVTALRAPALEALTPLLDGTRDAATLLRDAPAGLGPEQVRALTGQLMEAGLLSSRPATPAPAPPEALAFWEAAGLDSGRAADTVAAATVSVEAVGDADDGPVRAACTGAGLTVTEDAAELRVVLCTDYLDPALARIDAEQRAAGRPWLLAKPTGTRLWLGPVFRPGEPAAACWHCLAHRLWIHRRAEQYVQSALGRSGPAARPAVGIAPLTAAAGQLVALEAEKWLAGHRYAGQHTVWTVDLLDMEGRHHELRARPQCHSCGDPGLVGERTRQPVRLDSRPAPDDARPSIGGEHRALAPEQVLDRYRHLVSPVTGLVRELRPDTRGPAFGHSYRAGANLAVGTGGPADLQAGSEHGGKGVTAAEAECGALCEALERHSGSFHGDEVRIPGRLRELGPDAIHPNAIQLVHDRQFADRADWNRRQPAMQHVPEPFDADTVADWTPVWSLTAGRHRLVPTALLYYGAPTVAGLRPDSNGSAAGGSLEDAVLHGFLELVERDAVALWWYNRTPLPGVDLDAFADPWIDGLREVHAGLHREVWALDLTADLGVPAVVALSRRTDKPAEDIVLGFGAHVDPRVALRRALTELGQLLPAVVDAGRDGAGYGCAEPDALRWWRTATVANQPYLRPSGPPRGPADFDPTPRAPEEIVAGAGLELLVLDQTRPDIGLPVARVIVPGLRHFWARFAPGRLYDVPVRLGRGTAPTPYEELNPLPLFV